MKRISVKRMMATMTIPYADDDDDDDDDDVVFVPQRSLRKMPWLHGRC